MTYLLSDVDKTGQRMVVPRCVVKMNWLAGCLVDASFAVALADQGTGKIDGPQVRLLRN